MIQFTQLPPLSLYVHLPWCARKCPYCDFNSHQAGKTLPEQAYLEALLRDLENELPDVWGRRVQTIFIGGGTPSLFSPTTIDQLLAGIRARIPVSSQAEITLEANPGTLDNQRLAGFREAGVNRLSIGVQSFNNAHLERLGRIHDADQAIQAIESARHGGFDNINLDLMFALPGQNLQQAGKDLETAIDLQPSHISYYQLTLEPNTWFYRHPPQLPGDDESWQFQQQGIELLSQAGYAQYEVSAFARAGKQCRHNLNYWQFGDYLGIGAGAHGKISRADTQTIERIWKNRHPQAYLQQPESDNRQLTSNDVLLEFMMNALRLKRGVSIDVFCTYTGLDQETLHYASQEAIEQGLLEDPRDRNRVKTTEKGWRFLDSLLEMFLPTSPNS